MFLDQVLIKVKAGDGGSGASSFRREKFVPKGGPDGGDGGNGGDVIIRVDDNLSTLIDFHYRPHFKAAAGQRGSGKKAHGKSAAPLYLKVPPGTMVYDEGGNLLADLVKPNSEIIVAKGGRGGRGNASFQSNRNKAPRLYEKGEPGEARELRLDLKLIADVGLVGFPNAGKSTFLSRVTDAHPKIASYPFTTLSPNLGVVIVDETKRFVMADIPGLIEGAHEGVGMGDKFLKHIERTRLLIQFIDPANNEERGWIDEFKIIDQELREYSEVLASLPRLIAVNKIDITDVRGVLPELKRDFKKMGLSVYAVSAVTGKGTRELVYAASKLLDSIPRQLETRATVKKVVFEPRYKVKKEGNAYIISGKEPEKWVHITDFTNFEARQRLDRIFEKLGINQALEDAGIEEGDTIVVGESEFVFSRY